jgi:hypothetical protein
MDDARNISEKPHGNLKMWLSFTAYVSKYTSNEQEQLKFVCHSKIIEVTSHCDVFFVIVV